MTVIHSDCAGTVWKVLAAAGDQVAEGDVLVILEAMKMEIPIEAEADGVVAAVHVAEGEFVTDGAPLVTLED